MEKKIAILEGDGIGPEIMREGVKVLNAVKRKYGHKFDLVYAPFGASAFFKHGESFPECAKKICEEADAVVKGPIGLGLKDMRKIPLELNPETGLRDLRKMLDTYANYRPIRLSRSLTEFSPLKTQIIGDGIDIMMMRELIGGIYFGRKVEGKETSMDYAQDDCVYTWIEIERFAHAAFKEARKKGKKLTSIHKANVLATSRFWNDVFGKVGQNYKDVKLESMLVDNAAYQLVRNPRQFNGVMALENMQGDILTDLAGGVIGSLGLMPSASLNFETGKGYFEPSHGSAPDIAGKNIANPYSMIGSIALMLEKSFGLEDEARDIWDCLDKVFLMGYRTADLANASTPKNKIASTSQFGELVENMIENG
jgi:3-isopropylmalate dehydrogenase